MFKWLIFSLISFSVHATTHDVYVGDNYFNPGRLHIQVGDSVRFYKTSSGNHNVVADDGSFRCALGCDGDGGNGNPTTAQWDFTLTFNDPGLFGFHCEVHGGIDSGMSGSITVMDGPLDFFFVADTAQETSSPVGTSEFTQGAGALRWDYDTEFLTWHFYYEQLTDTPTAAHIHGPANMGANGSVLLNLGDASSSPVSGIGTFTEADINLMRDGLTYVNIHTADNPSGEIRGQIYPIAQNYTWEAIMTTDQITSPLTGDTSMSTGQAVLTFNNVTKSLRWNVTYSGLTSDITNAHIHAPARTDVTGPEAFTVASSNQASPISSGVTHGVTLNKLAYTDAGLSYIKINTQTNPTGEIRGQFRPIIFKGSFD